MLVCGVTRWRDAHAKCVPVPRGKKPSVAPEAGPAHGRIWHCAKGNPPALGKKSSIAPEAGPDHGRIW
eukprot:10807654-Alexandrium_andersonii.AAC.1